MRQELITYDIFCQTIQKMQEQGEKISVRTILSHTGGSFAKIADFLKHWRAEQAYAQSQTGREISQHLTQAILAEIGKAEEQAKAVLEAQLTQANEQLEESHEILSKQEKLIGDYEQQIAQLNQQVAVMTQVQHRQSERMQQLEKKLEQTVEAQHSADKRAAIAEARYAELEKQRVNTQKKSEMPKEKQAKQRKVVLT